MSLPRTRQNLIGYIIVNLWNNIFLNLILMRDRIRSLFLWVECSPMVQETEVQSHVESYQRLKKWYLIPPCLTLSIIRYVSRVMWNNPGKGVAPSTTPRCSSYWKGSLHVDHFNRTLAWWLECLPMARETWVQSQVDSYQRLKKWYLMPPCLALSIIRYVSRVKLSNPGKEVAPSPTSWCGNYRKGSLRVTLDYGHQLYLHICVFISWPIVIEGDSKTPFSITTTPKCREGR